MPSKDRRREAWERHRREQARRFRELSYRQRLDWLWQAKQFARRALGAARSPPDGPAEGEPPVSRGSS